MTRSLLILLLFICCIIVDGDVIPRRAKLSARRDGVGGIRAGDRFFFAGGFEYNDLVPTNIIEVYNITSGEWEEPLHLSEARGFVSTAVIGDNIYFIGGTHRSNCSRIYNTELHNYEQIGCGPTVLLTKQISVHNGISTFLGSFSADFFHIANKEWYYIPELTSRMQRISGAITVAHENLIIGIGGVNETTLDLISGAWIFDTQTNETKEFNNVTTLKALNVPFKFTTGHGKIVIATADRYFVHQFGTTEWHEKFMENIILLATLADVIIVANTTTALAYNPSTGAENWFTERISDIFPLENQVLFRLLPSNNVLVYKQGTWTKISLGASIKTSARWSDKLVFYLEGNQMQLYDPQVNNGEFSILLEQISDVVSLLGFNDTLLVIFKSTSALLYDSSTQNVSAPISISPMRDNAVIGTDILSPYNLVVWINFDEQQPINTQATVSAPDQTVIFKLNAAIEFRGIEVFNHVTKQKLETIPMNMGTPIGDIFAPVVVLDDMITVFKSAYQFRYNLTSMESSVKILPSDLPPEFPSLRAVNRIPVLNNVGYLPAVEAASILRINATSTTFDEDRSFSEKTVQFVTSEGLICIATSVGADHLSIFTRDIASGALNKFQVPQKQQMLSIAYANGTLVALGSDRNIYAVKIDNKDTWYNVSFPHTTWPTIIETIDINTIMIAAGKHYQFGFYTDEVLFINASAIIELGAKSVATPLQDNTNTVPPNDNNSLEAEIIVAIVVPIVAVVVAGAIALTVVLVKKRNKNKRSMARRSIGLESQYGAWFTPFNQISFGDLLGQGASGQVFKGTWKSTTVALKVSMTQAHQSVIRELELMMQLRPHPNVVQLLGFSVHPETDSIILIIEFCEGGSLDKKLYDSNETISLQTSVQWLAGIAKGLNHLHSNNVVHRDVASRNILVHRNEPKLTDFGMSRIVDDQKQHGTTKSELGPIRWMSPESLKDKEYSAKSDVWSFGILVFEVIARQEPHSEADPIEIGRLIRDSGLTPVIPSTCNPQLSTIMKQCWQKSSESRPNADALVHLLESVQFA